MIFGGVPGGYATDFMASSNCLCCLSFLCLSLIAYLSIQMSQHHGKSTHFAGREAVKPLYFKRITPWFSIPDQPPLRSYRDITANHVGFWSKIDFAIRWHQGNGMQQSVARIKIPDGNIKLTAYIVRFNGPRGCKIPSWIQLHFHDISLGAGGWYNELAGWHVQPLRYSSIMRDCVCSRYNCPKMSHLTPILPV